MSRAIIPKLIKTEASFHGSQDNTYENDEIILDFRLSNKLNEILVVDDNIFNIFTIQTIL